jgi:hypothetical protein
VTVGMAAAGVALFIFVSRLFPVVVVAGQERPRSGRAGLRAAAGQSPRRARP